MNTEKARFNMVEQQIRPWQIVDTKVLDLLYVVKREQFVPASMTGFAFADIATPLRAGQKGEAAAHMFPPKVEARVLQALAMQRHEKVLEIGTGSGYMAALLGAHADHVWSIEIDPEQADAARASLDRAGVTNVLVETADGLSELPAAIKAKAPFDVIMISGGVSAVPKNLLSLLKSGGRLFSFVEASPTMQAQLITRVGDDFKVKVLFETVVDRLLEPTPASTFVF